MCIYRYNYNFEDHKNMPQIRTLNSCALNNIGIYEYIYIYIIRSAC